MTTKLPASRETTYLPAAEGKTPIRSEDLNVTQDLLVDLYARGPRLDVAKAVATSVGSSAFSVWDPFRKMIVVATTAMTDGLGTMAPGEWNPAYQNTAGGDVTGVNSTNWNYARNADGSRYVFARGLGTSVANKSLLSWNPATAAIAGVGNATNIGGTWDARTGQPALVFANTKFFVDGHVMSTTGITNSWTAAPGTTPAVNRSASNGALAVCLLVDTSQIYTTSNDFTSMSTIVLGSGFEQLDSVVWQPIRRQFVITGRTNSGARPTSWTSPDGVTWTQNTAVFYGAPATTFFNVSGGLTGGLRDLQLCGEMLVARAEVSSSLYGWTAGDFVLVCSLDGISWRVCMRLPPIQRLCGTPSGVFSHLYLGSSSFFFPI